MTTPKETTLYLIQGKLIKGSLLNNNIPYYSLLPGDMRRGISGNLRVVFRPPTKGADMIYRDPYPEETKRFNTVLLLEGLV